MKELSCMKMKDSARRASNSDQSSMLDRISEFLVQHANPSIVYHVKNDILKNIADDEKRGLQDRILQEKIIQSIITCQKENGWLGNGFHGSNKNAGPYENQEVGVKYLGEKLVYKDTPVLKNAIDAFNPEGIVYVFNDYEKWPCWYHLDILAHTNSWRNSENIAMLADSFNKLLKDTGLNYSPAYCVDIGHLVGCCGAYREGMKLGMETGGEYYVFLDLVEYMCRCGLYSLVPPLKKEVDIIYDSIDEQGICRANYVEKALKGMGCYGGGQLEVDWRSRTRKLCDVTYRGLLILYHSGLLTH